MLIFSGEQFFSCQEIEIIQKEQLHIDVRDTRQDCDEEAQISH